MQFPSEALTCPTVSPPFFCSAFLSRQGLCPADADLIVRNRHVLKGSQLTIFDDLSSAKRAAHQALWPIFTNARSMGLKAQFKRAKLFITSKSTPYQVVL